MKFERFIFQILSINITERCASNKKRKSFSSISTMLSCDTINKDILVLYFANWIFHLFSISDADFHSTKLWFIPFFDNNTVILHWKFFLFHSIQKREIWHIIMLMSLYTLLSRISVSTSFEKIRSHFLWHE